MSPYPVPVVAIEYVYNVVVGIGIVATDVSELIDYVEISVVSVAYDVEMPALFRSLINMGRQTFAVLVAVVDSLTVAVRVVVAATTVDMTVWVCDAIYVKVLVCVQRKVDISSAEQSYH